MTDQQELPAMVQALDDAVYELTKVQTTRIQGRPFTAPSLFVQMTQAVHGINNGVGSMSFRSSSPAWLDGVDWIKRVEHEVREWLPHHHGHTLTLLQLLPEQKWTPTQADEVAKMAHKIHGWTRQAEVMLSGEGELEVLKPCPECSVRHVYRQAAGETIRQPALTVNSRGARCRHCSTEWGPEMLEFLARLVGATPVEHKAS